MQLKAGCIGVTSLVGLNKHKNCATSLAQMFKYPHLTVAAFCCSLLHDGGVNCYHKLPAAPPTAPLWAARIPSLHSFHLDGEQFLVTSPSRSGMLRSAMGGGKVLRGFLFVWDKAPYRQFCHLIGLRRREGTRLHHRAQNIVSLCGGYEVSETPALLGQRALSSSEPHADLKLKA